MKKILFFFKILPFGTALKIILLKLVYKLFNSKDTTLFFSQFGEDKTLNEYFWDKNDGFYIDIGCYKPISYSNTFFLYLKGWTGLAIDANKAVIDEFKKIRKRDISICVAVSSKIEEVTYYQYETDSINTIDEQFAKDCEFKSKLINESTIKTNTINSILEEHLVKGKEIDFLNIDIEGKDFEIISTFDFNRYQPTIIAIENVSLDLSSSDNNEINTLLSEIGYKLIAHVKMTSIFVKN